MMPLQKRKLEMSKIQLFQHGGTKLIKKCEKEKSQKLYHLCKLSLDHLQPEFMLEILLDSQNLHSIFLMQCKKKK